MEQCGECLCQEDVCYYCCCVQIFLCKNCAVLHYEHFLLNKDLDISSSIVPSCARDQVLVRLEAWKLRVNEYYNEQHKLLNSEPKPNSPPVLPNFRLQLQVNKALTDHLFSLTVYTCNEKSQILKITITQNTYRIYPINLQNKLSSPFWVLEWQNNLIILGGKIGKKCNKKIELFDLQDYSMKTIAELPEEISSFSPIIYEDHLFIIGGSKTLPFQGSSPVNTVLCLNLNTRQYTETLYLTRDRFRVTSCMINNSLVVLSENCPSVLEYKQLNTDLSFQEQGFGLDFTLGSCIAYDSDTLYFFNNQGVFKFVDLNTMESTQIASFENVQDALSSCIWNQTRAPCFHNGSIYFFSLQQMICVDGNGLVSVLEY